MSSSYGYQYGLLCNHMKGLQDLLFSPLLQHINILEYSTPKINGEFKYNVSVHSHRLHVRVHLVEDRRFVCITSAYQLYNKD